MIITYNGHACFSITSGNYTILIDPYSPGSVPGYGDLDETANLVLCTHEHHDHNAREVIHLENGTDSPFRINRLATWHDDQQGKLRGANTIFVLEAEGETIVHLGDLGCRLTESELNVIRGCSVLLIPVGGHYTIDADTAVQITRAVNAKLTIPMHYSGNGFGYPVIGPVSNYLRQLPGACESPDPSISLPLNPASGKSSRIIALRAKYRLD